MYVLNYKKQVERISQMIPLRKNDQTFEVYYHDPQSGELWKSFFPYGKKKSNDLKLLRPEPLPLSIEHQLELCLNSGNIADAAGLGIEYSLSPEKWDEILSVLDLNRKRYVRSGFFEFFKKLGIKNPEKNLSALQTDSTKELLPKKQLLSLKRRAKKLWLKKFFAV